MEDRTLLIESTSDSDIEEISEKFLLIFLSFLI